MSAYRADIDGLRAVAVLSVVLYHAGLPGVGGGFVGVDVFFVISGFLITRILQQELDAGRLSIVGFYERRARRILPALAVVLASSFAVGWVLLSPYALREFAGSALATALFASNFWFWQTRDYFAQTAEILPLLHTWSLAVEEQFYILFPLLLFAVRRRTRRTLVLIIAGICAASFLLSVVAVAWSPTAAFYLAPTRAWELGIGALLALAPMNTASRPLRETAAALGLAAILASVALIDVTTPFPGMAALPACLGAAALIWAGGQGATRVGALLSLRAVTFVGLISYSLYLWHWPILVYLRIYFGVFDLPVPVAAAAVAASFAAAALSWRFVEQPFRSRPPRGFGRRAIFAGAAAAVAAGVVASAAVLRADGLPGRFAPAVLAAFDAGNEELQSPERRLCTDRPPARGLCRLSAETTRVDDGPADFLFWGDSHAMAIAPAAAAVAGETGRAGLLATKGGCMPLLGLDRRDLEPSHACAAFNAEVLAFLHSRRDMPLVVLVARWALYGEGRRPAGYGGPTRLAADGETTPRSVEENFARFRDAVGPTVAAIRATGRDVVILGSMPEIEWDVANVYARHLSTGTALPPLPRYPEETRQARMDALFADQVVTDGVRFYSLADRACDPDCRVVADGRPLYRDNNHLSLFGALQIVGPILRAELDGLQVGPDAAAPDLLAGPQQRSLGVQGPTSKPLGDFN